MVLDQALIGILRGDLQFWRNTLFAAIKLVTLFLIGLFFSPGAGMIMYVTWLIGNVVSLVVIFFGQKPKAAVQETPGKCYRLVTFSVKECGSSDADSDRARSEQMLTSRTILASTLPPSSLTDGPCCG